MTQDKARRIGRRRGMDDGADAELDKVDSNLCGASSSGNIGVGQHDDALSVAGHRWDSQGK